MSAPKGTRTPGAKTWRAYSPSEQVILDAIRKHGRCTRIQLLTYVQMSNRNMIRLLTSLHKREMIRAVKWTRPPGGPQAVYALPALGVANVPKPKSFTRAQIDRKYQTTHKEQIKKRKQRYKERMRSRTKRTDSMRSATNQGAACAPAEA